MDHLGNISVNGDGNAVGNNNHILIDKRIFNTITHQSPLRATDARGEGGSSSGRNSIGLAVLVLIGIAMAAWKSGYPL